MRRPARRWRRIATALIGLRLSLGIGKRLAMLRAHLKSFQKARKRIVDDARFDHPWVCKTGLWPENDEPKAAVLKLLKQRWSPDPQDVTASTTGIFFSVWIDDSATARGGLHYNLHALKLRQLAGYRLESRKFASAFREAFLPSRVSWPDVSTQFGPQTLFQGFITCKANQVAAVTVDLAMKFSPIGSVIDRLLSDAAQTA
jgi:hypothetical protein